MMPYLADTVCPAGFQAVLALYDSTGKEVAYAGLYQQDPVIYYEVPATARTMR